MRGDIQKLESSSQSTQQSSYSSIGKPSPIFDPLDEKLQ